MFLKGNYIKNNQIKTLNETLKVNSSLIILNLSKSEFDIESLEYLSDALKVNSSLI